MNTEGTYTFMPDKDYYSTLSNPASTETIICGNFLSNDCDVESDALKITSVTISGETTFITASTS